MLVISYHGYMRYHYSYQGYVKSYISFKVQILSSQNDQLYNLRIKL